MNEIHKEEDMPASIATANTRHTTGETAEMSRKCKDAKQARRLNAVALAAEGEPGRAEIAKVSPVDRRSAEGPEGLKDRPRCGRPPLLDEEQRAEVGHWLEEGRIRARRPRRRLW